MPLAFGLGWMEITLILVVIVLLFGTTRLPELGKGLGAGIKNFKSAIRDEERKEIGEGGSSTTTQDADRNTVAR